MRSWHDVLVSEQQPEDEVGAPVEEEATPDPDVTTSDEPAPPPGSDRVFSLGDPTKRKSTMAQAKATIARGRLIVMPTDTVYGLTADAFDPAGVRRLLRAKGRGRKVPTPVLIPGLDTLRALATGLTPEARELTREFWPGGLTLICRQQPSLRWDLGDSRGTVALRMPDHEDALAILEDNGPLAVSSANKHGEPPATTIDEAVLMLGSSVEMYLDGGPTPGARPSTILDATDETLRLVREGIISVERLREVVPSIQDDEPDDD
jgi:L-threonylcarbamoyladenylate synthase